MRRVREWLAGLSVYYGWVIVVSCFLASGVVFGMTYSFGVFLDPLTLAFDVSTAQASLVFGVQLFVLYTASPPMGGLVGLIGARRGLVLAGILLGGGMVAGSYATSLVMLILTYSIVTGSGMSLAFVIGYATPPQWFERRRGMATGLASAGLGVGMLVVAPIAAALVARLGWRWAFLVLGSGLGLTLFLAAVLAADDPGEVDAAIDAEFPGGYVSSDNGWRGQFKVVREAMRNHSFLLLFSGYVLLYGTLYVLLNHLVNYAGSLGIRATGVLAISVIGGSTALTRLVMSGVADQLGRVSVFVVCGMVMSLALLLLPIATVPVAVLGIAVLFGIGYGGTGALLSAVPADLFGGENLNTLFGLASLSFAVPGLLSPWLASYGVDQLGTYTPVFIATGLVGLVGVGLIGVAAYQQGELGG